MARKASLYTDGASRGNPGQAAIAYILIEDGRILREHGETIGIATNNEAEYRALIAGLKAAAALDLHEVAVHSDSELMVKQMKGSYAVRSSKLIPLYKQATEAKTMFDRVTFTSLPREDPIIQKADARANEALDGKIPLSPVESRPEAFVKAIGVVSSPYKVQADAPRQGRPAPVRSSIEIYPEYEGGLDGLSDYGQLFILSWFDRSRRDQLRVERPGRGGARGVFATRSPNRPNPIGLTLVDLLEINGRILCVRGLDALDGTPILDIKPYEPDLDSQ